MKAPQPDVRERLLVWALPLLCLLVHLGGAPLFDVDEGAFSEATREMLERGDYLSTWLNGAPRFDKPILIYWLQALAVAVFGVTEWAFRLPSALAACGWAWAVWAFVRPRWGREVALGALLVTCTALGPWAIGRAATADALLNLWLALALFDAWRHWESGARAPLLRSYAWMGLGVLTKGPVAILIPLAVTALEALARRDARTWLRAVFDPRGWVILLVLVVPWYAAMLAVHGQAFIDGFILRHNVQRFTTTLEGHSGSLLYYVVVLPLLLLPWSGVLWAALRRLRTDWHDPLARYLWLWCGFVVVFFSLSGTKLPHYALYGATPLFVLLARHGVALRHGVGGLVPPTLLLALLVALPEGLAYLGRRTDNGYYQALLALAQDSAGGLYRTVTVGVLVAWLVVAAQRRWTVWQRLGAAAGLQVALLALLVVPWLGQLLQGPVKEAGLRARALGVPAVQWRFDAPSFSVYRQAPTPKRAAEPGELALTRIDRTPDWPHTVIYQRGGVVLLQRTGP
ncbi:Undecaprenyl phosphate-alpha-4-amino-4-deoxy-L-arabinose arabinosyl transferase [Tepidimonas thermarum]|uniref:Undecaprenyl phosphate-alpha-4-amino-4-deoxy-L-arabinose arabinosyl transferase n=1 Tax=Tepidimonas thermarum TaxID=335431 RepID=A0A554WZ27_9BURK|nr:glycosyltransferase family 39 protein [Tepidimonas thermarum]TSE28808.1 Undecaprenyl phosphate-alpha-4-amino-4-deoxy-L-arabinose arabinosyl transferase [Tepidimonas thermarum]